MRFGIFDHLEVQGSIESLYEDRLQMLEIADQAGFWCYHKAEHHHTVLDAAPSSTVFLAAASQRTEKIRLGSLVLLLPFYNPIRLIEEICVLDQLSNGRIELGVGKGISPVEHQLWGLAPEEAQTRFDEAFEILRSGLSTERLSFKGKVYDYDDVPIVHRTRQAPHPPFWYPGNFQYAGEHCLSTIIGGPTAILSEPVARYRELVAQSQSNWNADHQPTIGVTRHVYLAETDEQALARVQTAFPTYNANLVSLWDAYDTPLPNGGPALQGQTDKALAMEVLIAGSPETIASHIEHLVESTTIDYFVAAFRWGDLTAEESAKSLRLFAEEVMPRLKT